MEEKHTGDQLSNYMNSCLMPKGFAQRFIFMSILVPILIYIIHYIRIIYDHFVLKVVERHSPTSHIHVYTHIYFKSSHNKFLTFSSI